MSIKEAIHIEKASVGYREEPILQNITVSVDKGEFIVFFGANGAGKSTLLKTISGEIPLIEGRINIFGKNVEEMDEREKAKKIAIITTDKIHNPYLSVYDVLEMGRIPYLNLFAQLQEEDKKIIHTYSDLLSITHLWTKKITTLSDGQKQKVFIARALIQETEVILLDEPTAHLDIKNRVETFSLLAKLAKEHNRTILCATHEINIALEHSSTVWMIDKHQNFIADSSTKFNPDIIYCNLF